MNIGYVMVFFNEKRCLSCSHMFTYAGFKGACVCQSGGWSAWAFLLLHIPFLVPISWVSRQVSCFLTLSLSNYETWASFYTLLDLTLFKCKMWGWAETNLSHRFCLIFSFLSPLYPDIKKLLFNWQLDSWMGLPRIFLGDQFMGGMWWIDIVSV